MNKTFRNSFLLFLATLIWGTAFVAQQVGMDHIGPLTFTGIRSLLGSLSVFVYILIRDRLALRRREKVFGRGDRLPYLDFFLRLPQYIRKKEHLPERYKVLLLGGLCTGLAVAAATNLQQFGIKLTSSVGKAGFITSTYVIFVPLFGLLIGKRTGVRVALCALLSLVGFYLLSVKEGFRIEAGDFCLLASSLCYAVQILFIDHFSTRCDGAKLSSLQFFICGAVSLVLAFIFEEPSAGPILDAWLPIAYAGILSSGVAYTLQIYGQRDLDPTIASLIMCMESVISALSGALFLHQFLSLRQTAGCAIVLVSVLLVELPIPGRKRQTA